MDCTICNTPRLKEVYIREEAKIYYACDNGHEFVGRDYSGALLGLYDYAPPRMHKTPITGNTSRFVGSQFASVVAPPIPILNHTNTEAKKAEPEKTGEMSQEEIDDLINSLTNA